MGLDAMIFVFWMLSFKPAFLLSSFTFFKRLFTSSLLSTIRVVSSAYLRLLIFLPVILIPACASSSPAFHLMYCAYKLNKQDDNIQPWHTPNSLNDLKTKLCTVNLWFVSMTIYQLICKDMWLKSFPYHLFLLCKKTYIYNVSFKQHEKVSNYFIRFALNVYMHTGVRGGRRKELQRGRMPQ